MSAEELFDIVLTKAKDFGLVAKNDGRKIEEPKGNSIIRNNLIGRDCRSLFRFLVCNLS